MWCAVSRRMRKLIFFWQVLEIGLFIDGNKHISCRWIWSFRPFTFCVCTSSLNDAWSQLRQCETYCTVCVSFALRQSFPERKMKRSTQRPLLVLRVLVLRGVKKPTTTINGYLWTQVKARELAENIPTATTECLIALWFIHARYAGSVHKYEQGSLRQAVFSSRLKVRLASCTSVFIVSWRNKTQHHYLHNLQRGESEIQ